MQKKILASVLALTLTFGSVALPIAENTSSFWKSVAFWVCADESSDIYESKVNEILSKVNSNWSDFEKTLYIHDYLTLNCEYDFTYQNYAAENVIVDHKSVCQGYALAFKDLMNRLDMG